MYIGVHIDWTKLKINDSTEWPTLHNVPFDIVDKGSTTADGNAATSDNTWPKASSTERGLISLEGDAKQRPETGYANAHVLFSTTFTNNTDQDQEYTMKTEKTTSSEMTTEIENSWTKGIKMGVNLSTPGQIFQLSAGFSRQTSLTNTDGQTFEEVLTWGVESQIKVKAGHIADASLVVKEQKYSGDFKIISDFRGRIRVDFRNRRKKDDFIKTVTGNIVDVLRSYLKTEQRKKEYDFIVIHCKEGDNPAHVTIQTQGNCKFRLATKQDVVVNQTAIGG